MRLRISGLTASILVAAMCSTAGAAPITFSAPLTLPTGFSSAVNGPVLVGDLDGDGSNDLIATSLSDDKPSSISVLRGDGTGKFAAAKIFALGAPVDKDAVGDVNGDGKADLLVRTDAHHIQLLFAQSTAAFTPGPSFVVGTFAEPALADIDGEGTLDLVVLDAGKVTTYLGDGHGAFGAPIIQALSGKVSATTTVTDYADTPAISDFNSDGNADIALGTWIRVRHKAKHHKTKTTLESVAAVLPGRGDGHFGHVVVTRTGNPDATLSEPEVADFNGDGRPDLAAGAVAGEDQIEAALVMLNHGGGHFAKAHCYGFPSCKSFTNESGIFGYDDLAIGDFDGNGTADLAVTEFDLGYPRILSGDGHGAFSQQLLKGVPYNNTAVATGDLNHDASSDLVLFNGSKVTAVPGVKP